MSFISLSVGSRYPLPLKSEGAAAQFLGGNNILQIAMSNISKKELRTLKKTPEVGLIVDDSLILFVFKFSEDLIFDCPFDARLLREKGTLEIPVLESAQSRLSIEFHVIDTETMNVAVLRLITFSPYFTNLFLDAVNNQLANKNPIEPIYNKYLNRNLQSLAEELKMYKMGED